jgi:hypothetical protein
VVRGVFEALQSVPESGGDRDVQERAEGLHDIQRNDPVPGGQAAASGTGKEDGESAGCASRDQKPTLSGIRESCLEIQKPCVRRRPLQISTVRMRENQSAKELLAKKNRRWVTDVRVETEVLRALL